VNISVYRVLVCSTCEVYLGWQSCGYPFFCGARHHRFVRDFLVRLSDQVVIYASPFDVINARVNGAG
jgi:hypothetical protein